MVLVHKALVLFTSMHLVYVEKIAKRSKSAFWTKGKWSCGVCKKRVGNNSILCHGCKKWIHKGCSGLKEVCVMQANNRSSADAVR